MFLTFSPQLLLHVPYLSTAVGAPSSLPFPRSRCSIFLTFLPAVGVPCSLPFPRTRCPMLHILGIVMSSCSSTGCDVTSFMYVEPMQVFAICGVEPGKANIKQQGCILRLKPLYFLSFTSYITFIYFGVALQKVRNMTWFFNANGLNRTYLFYTLPQHLVSPPDDQGKPLATLVKIMDGTCDGMEMTWV